MLDVKTGHTFFGTSGLSENWCSAHSLTGHSWQSLSKVRKHCTSVATLCMRPSTRPSASDMQHTSADTTAECRYTSGCVSQRTHPLHAFDDAFDSPPGGPYPNARECDGVNKIKVNINVNTHPSNSCQNPAEPASIARKTCVLAIEASAAL